MGASCNNWVNQTMQYSTPRYGPRAHTRGYHGIQPCFSPAVSRQRTAVIYRAFIPVFFAVLQVRVSDVADNSTGSVFARGGTGPTRYGCTG